MKVRDRVPRGLGWWARAWTAAVVAWGVVAVLAVLPLGAGTVQQAHADGSATSVQGPYPWIPDSGMDPVSGYYGATGQRGTTPGKVTVSQTGNLRDQVVHVSWSGFTPSTDIAGNPRTLVNTNDNDPTYYPVAVYQCRGDHPGPTDCYGMALYGGDSSQGFQQGAPAAGSAPELPSNAIIATTASDGTGQADIEVWTSAQSQSLGCDATHKCSLVVVPHDGGDANSLWTPIGSTDTSPQCGTHTYDRDGFYNEASMAPREAQNANNSALYTGDTCAWNDRVVVPLSFSPTAADCKAAGSDFKMAGLEMANEAVQQWRAGFCQGSAALNLDYTSSGGEPQARSAFLRDVGPDVALTALPDSTPAPRPYVYAPLANTSISVGFVVDDPRTGQQIRQMRLNARLLAKELTQSYSSVPPGPTPVPASVTGNPTCLFADPEFLALNPPSLIAPAQWPSCVTNELLYPIVVGGTTDLVYQLTSWIAADPQAAAFLQGAPDEWGMHVDTFYQRPAFSGYPVSSLTVQDTTGVNSDGTPNDRKAHEWIPLIGGLSSVARHLLAAQPSSEIYSLVNGRYPPQPSQALGQRTLIAIMDGGNAQALSVPTAQLLNPAGSFVAPTLASMQSAVSDMPVDPGTGTQTLPYGASGSAFAKDAGAYPLTTVQYAMVPTAGQSPATATAISRFLQRATDPGGGQLYGSEPGKLAAGFLDLTGSQQSQAQAAVQHVQAQDGTLPGNQVAPVTPPPATTSATTPATAQQGGTGTGTTAGDTSANTAGNTGGGTGGNTNTDNSSNAVGQSAGTELAKAPASAAASRSGPASGSPSLAPVAAGQPAPDRAGIARMLMPVVLIAGGVLLVGGPAALVLGGTSAGVRAWSRLRKLVRGSG